MYVAYKYQQLFVPDCIVLRDFDAAARMIDTKNISCAGKAVGRVHDLRDAHSCMKKKCMEEGVGDVGFSCGMQLGSEDSGYDRSQWFPCSST